MKSSHVPHKSPVQVHATSIPDATQTVSRYPLYLSWDQERTPVLTSSIMFRYLISGSLTLISLNHTCRDPKPRLFLNAHHHDFWPQQLEVVWSLLLQAGSEGPTLISCAVARTLSGMRSWRTFLPKSILWFNCTLVTITKSSHKFFSLGNVNIYSRSRWSENFESYKIYW